MKFAIAISNRLDSSAFYPLYLIPEHTSRNALKVMPEFKERKNITKL